MDKDFILVECDLEALKSWVEEKLEPDLEITITTKPTSCLTMIKAEDSVEKQQFYLGEALTTECEVLINQHYEGSGICLGDDPVRAYCLSVVDAIYEHPTYQHEITIFLQDQLKRINEREHLLQNYINRSRVDFKMMDDL